MEAQHKLPINLLVVFYEEIQKRPRHVGALAAWGLLIWLTLAAGQATWTTVLITVTWFAGTVIGGYSHKIVKYLLPQYTTNLPGSKIWSGILIGGWSSSLLLAMILEGPGGALVIADLLLLPTCILYLFSKLGCYKFGCCGWSGKYKHLHLEDIVPLQILEVFLALITGIVIGFLMLKGAPPTLTATQFLILHGFQRMMSRIARGQPLLDTIFMLDAGGFVIVGFLLWVNSS